MFEDKTKILLVIPQGVVDRARVFAGEAMSKLKRPVSLQMVLRALIDEGLKRAGDRAVLSNVEGQVQAVRRIRSRGPEAVAVRVRIQNRGSGSLARRTGHPRPR